MKSYVDEESLNELWASSFNPDISDDKEEVGGEKNADSI